MNSAARRADAASEVPPEWIGWARAEFGLDDGEARAAARAAFRASARGGSDADVREAAMRALTISAAGPISYGGDVRQSGQYVAGHDLRIDQRFEVDLNPIRSARGVPRAIIVTGSLVALAGFAVVLYGMYEFATRVVGSPPSGGPPAGLPGIVQLWFVGFGVFFAGLVLTIVGGMFRRKEGGHGSR